MPSNTQDSPPPSPPTTHSPGIRANALQNNFDQALSHTLRACSYENFAACFPTPATHVPEALHGLHREFVGKLEHVCKAEFKALIEERNVVPSLNELDGLIADARKRLDRSKTTESQHALEAQPPNPPHLLQPTSLLEAHLAMFLASQTSTLTSTLDMTQQSNTELAEEIALQRSTIDGLIQSLENVMVDIEGAASVLVGEEINKIEAELEEAATAHATV